MSSPTLSDIAQRCGVSMMTVSRVVRGIGGVSEKTRLRIEEVLRELQYRPNPFSRILANQRQSLPRVRKQDLAIVAYLDTDQSEYSQEMFKVMAEESGSLGYRVEYHLLPEQATEQARLSRKLYFAGIRGVILGPAQNELRLEGFDISLFTIVSMGALEHMPAINSVSQDYFQGLYLAAMKCKQMGLKRIGLFIDQNTEARTGHRWLGAYYAFCSDWKIRPQVCFDQSRKPLGRDYMVEWVKRKKLDVLMTLYGCCNRNHLWPETIPQTRIVLLSDLMVPPGWWYLSVPMHLIARETMVLLNQQLIQQRYGPPVWPKQVLLKSQWNQPTD